MRDKHVIIIKGQNNSQEDAEHEKTLKTQHREIVYKKQSKLNNIQLHVLDRQTERGKIFMFTPLTKKYKTKNKQNENKQNENKKNKI